MNIGKLKRCYGATNAGLTELMLRCRGFNRTAVDKPPIFQLSQSEALQSVTAFQSFNIEECFVTITNLI